MEEKTRLVLAQQRYSPEPDPRNLPLSKSDKIASLQDTDYRSLRRCVAASFSWI
jgi:hypothetical protein